MQYFRLKQITEILSVSKSTIYAYMQQGRFPHPKKYGRISLWSEEDIVAFINSGHVAAKQS